MLKKLLVVAGIILLFSSASAEAFDRTVSLMLNGRLVEVEQGTFMNDGRVFAPVRYVAEEMGAVVDWDEESSAVNISYSKSQGDSYLKGKVNEAEVEAGIMSNLVMPGDLRDILDDDRDGELADYRQGKNGGDNITNDPLVVDIRKEAEYKEAHVPGAVWIAEASAMAETQNVEKLKALLSEHVTNRGRNEVVLYCYSGNTSALAAGVLGARGLPVRSMMYGFDIGWRGTKYAETPIFGKMEDNSGKTLDCGG